MEKGDIANTISPRLVVVFEGLVGVLPTAKERAQEQTYRKMRRWKRAVNIYVINEVMAKHLWDLTMRTDYSIDVVTYLGDEMATAIADRIDRESLPVGNTWATTPQQLSRKIALMPDVAAIYDPDRSHQFTYGSKGRIVDPASPNLRGNL